jgi:hypothetical protein
MTAFRIAKVGLTAVTVMVTLSRPSKSRHNRTNEKKNKIENKIRKMNKFSANKVRTF